MHFYQCADFTVSAASSRIEMSVRLHLYLADRQRSQIEAFQRNCPAHAESYSEKSTDSSQVFLNLPTSRGRSKACQRPFKDGSAYGGGIHHAGSCSSNSCWNKALTSSFPQRWVSQSYDHCMRIERAIWFTRHYGESMDGNKVCYVTGTKS